MLSPAGPPLPAAKHRSRRARPLTWAVLVAVSDVAGFVARQVDRRQAGSDGVKSSQPIRLG
jgi:hypothetical protein